MEVVFICTKSITFNVFLQSQAKYLYKKGYKVKVACSDVKNINLNRSNINETLKDKTLDLQILENDTNNVIEFNSSFSDEIKENKLRNFWNLLKSK